MAPRSSRNAGAPGAAVRAAAAGVVARVLRERVEADDALAAAEHGVAQRDRALLGALVYGTLRWHQRLEWQTARLLSKPLKPSQLELGALLEKARTMRIFGTKMRSVVNQADAAGIREIVAQQFEIARRIIAAGLVPIIEPEVDIHCPEKAQAEGLLKAALLDALERLPAQDLVMLKVTLPERDDLYAELVRHPKVVRVLALSGGYTQEEGNARLRRNHGVVASFSRALVEGLSARQSDTEYDTVLGASIQRIFEASIT